MLAEPRIILGADDGCRDRFVPHQAQIFLNEKALFSNGCIAHDMQPVTSAKRLHSKQFALRPVCNTVGLQSHNQPLYALLSYKRHHGTRQ